MTDNITLRGLVATTPRHIVTSEGLAITSFRLERPVDSIGPSGGSTAPTGTITAFGGWP